MNTKQEYRLWANERLEDLPLFLQPWLLDAVCLDDWNIALYHNKEHKLTGALPYFIFRKNGIKIIGMPYLMPYMGVYIDYPANQKRTTSYEYEKEVLTGLIAQIPSSVYLQQKFFPEYIYGLPFFWKGYRLDWRYTYHLSLRQSEEAIWDQMEGSARTQLLKTMKAVTVEKSDDTRAAYQLVSLTFSRQSLKVPYSLAEFERMYKAIKEREAGSLYVARLNENNTPVAAMFMVKDKSKVYNLVLGRDHHRDPGGSIHGILWKCIQEHIGKHDLFDFEGSMLEGPERMFRSFGSIRMPVLQVTRFKNNIWRSIFALAGR